MTETDRLKRLFDRARNDLKALNLSLTRREKVQARLLRDIASTLSLIETEVLKSKSELATERSELNG